MRTRVFVLTCLAFSFQSSLRLSYAYVKPYFKQQYELSNLFLAVLDSLTYLALGIGLLVRYSFYRPQQIYGQFLVFGLVYNASILIFAVLSALGVLNHGNVQPILAVLIFAFGFFQCNAWPVLIVFLNDYFRAEKDGAIIGLWSSSNEFGSMISVVTMPFLILTLGCPWQLSLILVVLICIGCNTLVYFFVPRNARSSSDSHASNQQLKQVENQATLKEFCIHSLEYFRHFQVLLYILIVCLTKAIIYTASLWIPSYVKSEGAEHQFWWIGLLYGIASIIGPILVGLSYEHFKGACWGKLPHIVLMVCGVGLSVVTFLLSFIPFQVGSFAILISFFAFFIGGIFGTLIANQMMRLANGDQKEVEMLMNLSLGYGNISIFVMSILTGVHFSSEESKQNTSDVYGSMFDVFQYASYLTLLLLIIKIFASRNKTHDQNQPQQLQQVS